jgi:uncharacterized membrane protein YkoI
MRRTTLAVAALIVVSVHSVLVAEESVPLDKIPQAIKDAIAKQFPDAEVTDAEKEVEDGKTLYEVDIVWMTKPKKEGRKPRKLEMEVTLAEDGQIEEVERSIPPKRLPAPISDALNAKYPGHVVQEAEAISKLKQGKVKLDSYEVSLQTKEKSLVEVSVAKDGTILSEETDDEKEEKEEKED